MRKFPVFFKYSEAHMCSYLGQPVLLFSKVYSWTCTCHYCFVL